MIAFGKERCFGNQFSCISRMQGQKPTILQRTPERNPPFSDEKCPFNFIIPPKQRFAFFQRSFWCAVKTVKPMI